MITYSLVLNGQHLLKDDYHKENDKMIRIIVDSSSDYTLEELKEKNMQQVSLTINIGDKSYKGGVDITPDEFYEMLIDGAEFPKTSQPSPQDFLEIFDDAKEKGDSVICILLSSGLSGTFQSATIAKSMADYDEIYLVDSLAATHLIRVMADYACKLRDEGKSVSEIVEAVRELQPRVKVIAGVDTLEFLYKGGRLSKASAVIGGLANLKPIITIMEDGTLSVIGKCIGRNKAISFITSAMEEKKLDPDFPVYSVYAYGSENTEKLEQKLEAMGIQCEARLQLGTTIGAHIGPGAFAVIYVEK